MSPVHQVWPKPSCKAQWKGEEDKADRRRGGKATSGNGQAWSSTSPRGRWRTEEKKWRKLVAKSSVVPQRPSWLRDRWGGEVKSARKSRHWERLEKQISGSRRSMQTNRLSWPTPGLKKKNKHLTALDYHHRGTLNVISVSLGRHRGEIEKDGDEYKDALKKKAIDSWPARESSDGSI